MNILDKLNNLKETMPDLQIKELNFKTSKVYVFNIQTVSSSVQTNDFILNYLSNISIFKNNILNNLKKDINNYIPSVSIKNIKEDEVLTYLFNGFSVLIYKKNILAFETKASLDRGINESTSEPSIKGPKDSFNENYNTNIGLIRKRIKDENFHIKEYSLGEKTKNKTAIMYMNDIVDKSLLSDVINRISSIKTDNILDTYYIKSLLKKENKTPFPTIKSTEKPDMIAKCLLEGKICILTENSNNVLIAPTFFIDFFYNDEDNYQKKTFTIFVKIIRLLALFLSILAPSIYLALITYDQQILPTSILMNFALQRQDVPFPVLVEAAILMVTYEILYEGDALTPTSRGTALSILGALVLGDAAVSAGMVSPIMVIVVALTAVSSLFFVYYDLQSFIRIYRYFFMILASSFGFIGILMGMIFMLTNLCSIKSFGKPFLIPIAPVLQIKSKNKLIKKGLLIQNAEKGDL